MAEKIFTKGIIIKEIETQHWTIKKISVKVDEFKEFLDTYDNNGRVNLNMNRGKSGKLYMELDTWKPNGEYKKPAEVQDVEQENTGSISVEDIPF